ncbi:toll/interleukin-1 receptor domain-containing protein [Streptomyces monticola]|uniref:Toll/interleukin-1 receptor domain-containing protein n=1 Tax=Streptomyces monticola TaxID=2666263 RepID=A0ABW2JAI3_9ACTN
MPQVFISHSVKDDALAEEVRQAVLDELTAKKYDVKVDYRDIVPGRDWNPELNQWLLECDAAVILLNAHALRSDWVRREVAILTFRRFHNPRLQLFPVLLGDLDTKDLDAAGLIDMAPVQSARFTAAQWADGGREKLTALLLDQFARLPDLGACTGTDDALHGWITRIARCLGECGTESLKAAAAQLGLTDADLAQVEGTVAAALFLAYQMLDTADQRLHEALYELDPDLPEARFSQLVKELRSIWVDVEAARHLLPREPDHGGVVVLTARVPDTAVFHVQRAFCMSLRRFQVQSAQRLPGGEEGIFEELHEACLDAIRELLGLRPGQAIRDYAWRPNVAHFLFLDTAHERPAHVTRIVRELRDAYPKLTVVLLTDKAESAQEARDRWKLDGLVVVTPHLTEKAEDLGNQLSTDLYRLPQRVRGDQP